MNTEFCNECQGPYPANEWPGSQYSGHWDTCPNRKENNEKKDETMKNARAAIEELRNKAKTNAESLREKATEQFLFGSFINAKVYKRALTDQEAKVAEFDKVLKLIDEAIKPKQFTVYCNTYGETYPATFDTHEEAAKHVMCNGCVVIIK